MNLAQLSITQTARAELALLDEVNVLRIQASCLDLSLNLLQAPLDGRNGRHPMPKRIRHEAGLLSPGPQALGALAMAPVPRLDVHRLGHGVYVRGDASASL